MDDFVASISVTDYYSPALVTIHLLPMVEYRPCEYQCNLSPALVTIHLPMVEYSPWMILLRVSVEPFFNTGHYPSPYGRISSMRVSM